MMEAVLLDAETNKVYKLTNYHDYPNSVECKGCAFEHDNPRCSSARAANPACVMGFLIWKEISQT